MMSVEDVARVCHEANRGLQQAQADPAIPVAAPWDEIDEDMRASVISGVEGILDGNTPSQSHEAWCEFRRAQGWVYGPVKDEVAKTHPCLVPYKELPQDQKVKDSLFSAIVLTLTLASMSDEDREQYDRWRAETKDAW